MKAILQGQKDKIQGEQGQFVGFNESGEMEAVEGVNSFDGVKGEVVRNIVDDKLNYIEYPLMFVSSPIQGYSFVVASGSVEDFGITAEVDSVVFELDLKYLECQTSESPNRITAYIHFYNKNTSITTNVHINALSYTNESKKWVHVSCESVVPKDCTDICATINQVGRPFAFFATRNVKLYKKNGKKNQIPTFSNQVGFSHRSIYRGKYLGDSVSGVQYASINSGSFFDIFIGDYWVINGTKYIVADLDYWYNTGNTNFTKHHAVIVPELNIGANKKMNSSNTTNNAYYGSEMYSTNLNDAKKKITTDFGDEHILQHRILLENASTSGYPSGYVWTDSKIDLMTEVMVYGTRHYAPMGTGAITPTHYTVDKTQLALFKLNPTLISTRQNYWLRDVVNASDFARVDASGVANHYDASAAVVGVRPAFAIGISD